MEVVPFKNTPLPGQAVPDVVEQLESLLARAKVGDIVNFAYAAERSDGAISTGWGTRDANDLPLTAAVPQLFWRWNQRLDNGGRDEKDG